MVTRDPAIEAATRAMPESYARQMPEYGIALAAASEALAPIRDLHKRHRDLEWDGEWSAPYCQTCAHEFYGDLCYQPWPCTTAKLVYSTEELENPHD